MQTSPDRGPAAQPGLPSPVKYEGYSPYSYSEAVAAFHIRFGLEYNGPGRFMSDDSEELEAFRLKFLYEELEEYVEALETRNKAKALDALIDLVYVALGNAYMHGFNFDEGFWRVHKANMAKVRAERKEDSKRGTTYDIVKPEGWTAPDLEDLV